MAWQAPSSQGSHRGAGGGGVPGVGMGLGPRGWAQKRIGGFPEGRLGSGNPSWQRLLEDGPSGHTLLILCNSKTWSPGDREPSRSPGARPSTPSSPSLCRWFSLQGDFLRDPLTQSLNGRRIKAPRRHLPGPPPTSLKARFRIRGKSFLCLPWGH